VTRRTVRRVYDAALQLAARVGVVRAARRRLILAARRLPLALRTDRQLAREAVQLGALQKVGELAKLVALVRKLRPRTVLEIGSARGGTFYVWSELAPPDAVLVSVDLPGGAFGVEANGAAGLEAQRRDARQTVRILRGDSHSPAVRDAVFEALAGRRVDFLFIDGDHTYDGVKQDFEWYGPLVRPGGVIAFHDIVDHPDEPRCQVDVLWGELKRRLKTAEIIDAADDRLGQWGGIGIVEVPERGTTGERDAGSSSAASISLRT